MFEAKAQDQGHKHKCSPKKRSSEKIFKRYPEKTFFQKIFQALHKFLTTLKIVLSSGRGQANFRGLEASRPRPRTSNCVLEDSTNAEQRSFIRRIGSTYPTVRTKLGSYQLLLYSVKYHNYSLVYRNTLKGVLRLRCKLYNQQLAITTIN